MLDTNTETTIESFIDEPRVGLNNAFCTHKVVTRNEKAGEVGYLKVTYIPQEAFDKYFDSIWKYKALRGNCRLKCLFDENLNASKDEIYKAFFRCDKVPDKKTRDKALEQEVSDKFRQEFRAFKDFHLNKPYIDAVRVNPAWRRMGIATDMYLKMARFLDKEFNLKMYASGIQTKHAEALWNSFEDKGWVEKTSCLDKNVDERRFLDINRVDHLHFNEAA